MLMFLEIQAYELNRYTITNSYNEQLEDCFSVQAC